MRSIRFLLPALLVYTVLMLYPIADTFYVSLFRWNGLAPLDDFIGLGNFHKLLEDEIFRIALTNSLIWTVASLIAPIAIGLILAVILNSDIPGAAIFRSIILIPFLFSPTAIGVMWRWLYNPQLGLVNNVLRSLGLDVLARAWLGDASTALLAAVIANTWQVTGFCMIAFYAGLQMLPRDVYDASKVDGAGPWVTFWKITIPLLRHSFVIVGIWVAAHSLKNFDIIWTMTSGGPGYASEVLATWMYKSSFSFYKVGYGAAIAVVILCMTLGFSLYYVRRVEDLEISR